MSFLSSAVVANTTPFHALGIDVGGTKIAAGLVTFPAGEIRARRQILTEPARGGEAVLADVLRLCKELTFHAEELSLRVNGIGMGVCELVDVAGNLISENCIAWKRLPVRETLWELAPTVIEADVRAAALAEAMFGAGQDFRTFLFVTVGTGISSCLVLDGKPFTGARGATGTMASSPLSGTCEKCSHENHRTLEEIAAGPALVARYNQRRPGTAKSAQDVLAAAASADGDAMEIVHAAALALGSTVGLLVNVLDPEAVIVGGGLGLSEGVYWENFGASTRRHIWSEVHRDLAILHATTGQDAGLIGAAATAWRKFSVQGTA